VFKPTVHKEIYAFEDFPRCIREMHENIQTGIPIVRVFHTDGPNTADNAFAPASGLIRPLDGLAPFDAALTVEKHRHSALVGTTVTAPFVVSTVHNASLGEAR